jgi:sodium/proline symporter
MVSPIALSFLAFLLMFAGIGVYSATRRRTTPGDYLVASRSVHPWLVALSAVATNNSGFMFVGITGIAYAFGVSAFWIQIGWIMGDYTAWRLIHRKLREHSETSDSITIPHFLGEGLTWGRAVVIAGAIITLGLLVVYASAQLTAGSKALAVFDIDPSIGVVLGAIIVVAYCFAGGIRASIWTDAAQSIVMLGSMGLLLAVALYQTGGLGGMWQALGAIDPALTSFSIDGLKFGLAGYVFGWIVAGFGVLGQPHIMIRTLTIDSPHSIARARRVYFTWFILFSFVCVSVGLAARVLLDVDALPILQEDNEMSFPLLAADLLPSVLVGLMLAGLFAATISTADSQVLACSAALTQDLLPSLRQSYTAVKVGTLLVTAAALGLAFLGGKVFTLVIFAWSALAAAFGPLLIVRTLRQPVSGPLALAMMAAGIAAVLAWRFGLKWHGDMYDAVPGMFAGALAYGAGRLFARDRSA